MNHCLGRPYAYEFNDLRAPGGNFGKKAYWLSPRRCPGGPRFNLADYMAQNEGVRPSVLKTKLSVHFGARSSVRSFTDDESPLAILYSSPPAVLFFSFLLARRS